MRNFLILIAILLLQACAGPQTNTFKCLAINTFEPERLADWYSDHLHFEKVTSDSVVLNGFWISMDKPRELRNMTVAGRTGYSKFGFQTGDFDNLYQKLKSEDVSFATEIFTDENLDQRCFIVKDPDGNLIQIFESEDARELTPYFFAINTPSIGEAEKWYQMNFPVLKTYNLDVPKDTLYIRLMCGDGFAIEAIQPKKAVQVSEVLPGFHYLEINSSIAPFETDKDGNHLVNRTVSK